MILENLQVRNLQSVVMQYLVKSLILLRRCLHILSFPLLIKLQLSKLHPQDKTFMQELRDTCHGESQGSR